MRRDYFTCVFLLYVAASLSFVCLLPIYFSYGIIIPREIGLFERLVSLLVSIAVVLVIPIYSAIKKKLWITWGAAAYGLLAYIPGMMLSKMDSSLSGSGASTGAVIKAFFLEAIYKMVNAPFAGVSKIVGNDFARTIPKLILPVTLGFYVIIQLYRFYRDAFIAEQLSPVTDATHKVDNTKNVARKPEILGTVISAPVSANASVKKVVTPAPAAPAASSDTKPMAPVSSDTRAVNVNPSVRAAKITAPVSQAAPVTPAPVPAPTAPTAPTKAPVAPATPVATPAATPAPTPSRTANAQVSNVNKNANVQNAQRQNANQNANPQAVNNQVPNNAASNAQAAPQVRKPNVNPAAANANASANAQQQAQKQAQQAAQKQAQAQRAQSAQQNNQQKAQQAKASNKTQPKDRKARVQEKIVKIEQAQMNTESKGDETKVIYLGGQVSTAAQDPSKVPSSKTEDGKDIIFLGGTVAPTDSSNPDGNF